METTTTIEFKPCYTGQPKMADRVAAASLKLTEGHKTFAAVLKLDRETFAIKVDLFDWSHEFCCAHAAHHNREKKFQLSTDAQQVFLDLRRPVKWAANTNHIAEVIGFVLYGDAKGSVDSHKDHGARRSVLRYTKVVAQAWAEDTKPSDLLAIKSVRKIAGEGELLEGPTVKRVAPDDDTPATPPSPAPNGDTTRTPTNDATDGGTETEEDTDTPESDDDDLRPDLVAKVINFDNNRNLPRQVATKIVEELEGEKSLYKFRAPKALSDQLKPGFIILVGHFYGETIDAFVSQQPDEKASSE
jgi:hypothetical protein